MTDQIIEDRDWAAAFAGVGTGTIASFLRARGYPRQFIAGLRNFGSRSSFASPAFTVRLVPYRADLAPAPGADPFRDVVETMPPGHVLVVDAMQEQAGGVVGDMLASRLLARGVTAVVTDGAVRDSRGLAPLAIPIFSRGVNSSLRSAFYVLGGVEDTIACGGVTVVSGDILVGDEDGVIVVPRNLASELAELSREQERLEEYLSVRVLAGESLIGLYPPDEVNRTAYEQHLNQLDAAGDQ